MPSLSKKIAPNLQPLCNVYIGQFVISKTEPSSQIKNLLKNNYMALIDTGANHSCITDKVAQQLKLKPIANIELRNTSGTVIAPVYEICLYIPSAIDKKQNANGIVEQTVNMKHFENHRVIEIKHHNDNNSFDIIIGMDIITKGHLTIVSDMLHFSY